MTSMASDRGHVCRACLSSNKLRPIFHELEHHDKYTRVLLAATGQQINLNDDLSQHICSSCITTINNIVKYQKKCEQTNQQLKKLLETNKQLNSKKILKTNKKHKIETITTEQILNFYAKSSKISSDDEFDSIIKQNDNCQSVTDIENDSWQSVINMQDDTFQSIIDIQNDDCQSVINMQDDTCQSDIDVDCNSVIDIQERACQYFTDTDDNCQSDVIETKKNDNCPPVMEMEHVKELNKKKILKNNKKHKAETITTEQILNFYANSPRIPSDESDSFIKPDNNCKYAIDIQNDTCQFVTDLDDNRQSLSHVIEIKQNNCQPVMEMQHVKDKAINQFKDKYDNDKYKKTDSKLQLLNEFDSDYDDDIDDSYSTVLQCDDLGLPKNKHETNDIEEFVLQKEKPENTKIKTDESIKKVSKSFTEIYKEILSHIETKTTKRNTMDDHIDHDHTYNSKSEQRETENESILNKKRKTEDKTLTKCKKTDSSFKYTKFKSNGSEHTVSTDRQIDGHVRKSNESFRYTDQLINESEIMREILLREEQNKINLKNRIIGKRNLRKEIVTKIQTSKNKKRTKDNVTNGEDKELNKFNKKMEKYSCDACSKVFLSEGGFKRHMKSHTGGYDIVCEHCSFRCYTTRVLLMHCRAKHGYEKKDKCSYCDYTAANREQVTVHERSHTGERPYVCETCGNSFARLSVYRNHHATHLEKTVKCDECPSRFKSVSLMKMHKYKHRGPLHTYKCLVCDGTFARARDVVKHLLAAHGAGAGVGAGAADAEGRYERVKLRPEMNPASRHNRLHRLYSSES